MRVVRTVVAVLLLAGCGSAAPAPAVARSGWVDQAVTFTSGGMTIYATYRHPARTGAAVPAALLIAGSGPTDRNGNQATLSHVDNLQAVAGWLSDDGVASLRYDKLGSGRTGLGPYAGKPQDIGLAVYTQEALDALKLLAAQKGVDRDRLSIAGHSEGALYALLLATGVAGSAPPVSSLLLLEPLSRRYLDVLTAQIEANVAGQVAAGKLTAGQQNQVRDAWSAAVAQLRGTGTVPADLPFGLGNLLSPTNARYLHEADRYDPAGLAARLPAGTRVLVSCSDADIQVSCLDTDHLVGGLSRPDYVHLTGVDHVLKEDRSRAAGGYDQPLPYSSQLATAIRQFVGA